MGDVAGSSPPAALSDPAWNVRESGAASLPAIVFLHGAGLSGGMWVDHMARLPGFHCLAPDLPGCGSSRAIPWGSHVDAADQVARLIRERAPAGRAHVVGLSVGGSIAHALLSRHADVVDRMLIDGAGVLPDWRDRLLAVAVLGIAPFLHSDRVIRALSRSVGSIPDGVQADMRVASRTAFWRSYTEALLLAPERSELAAIPPTLLVAGEREPSVRASNAALAGSMPNAIARYVPDAGHGWLGRRMELHLEMVAAWVNDEPLPAGLRREPSSRRAQRRLRKLAGLGA